MEDSRTVNESRLESLKAILAYLENQHGKQLDQLGKLDSQSNLRITVFTVLLGFIYLSMPGVLNLAKSEDLTLLYWITIGFSILLFICFMVVLWLTIHAFEVDVELPGVDPDAFRYATELEDIEAVKVHCDLIINYTGAIEANIAHWNRRVPSGRRLQSWSKATLVIVVMAVITIGPTTVNKTFLSSKNTAESPSGSTARQPFQKKHDLKTEEITNTDEATETQPNQMKWRLDVKRGK